MNFALAHHVYGSLDSDHFVPRDHEVASEADRDERADIRMD